MEWIFLLSVGVILWLAATSKLIAAFGHDRLLGYVDPVFGISNRTVMLSGGIVELLAVLLIVSSAPLRLKSALTAALGALFLGYRIALSIVGFSGWCPCLGSLGSAVLGPVAQKWVLTAIGMLMVAGGIAFNLVRRSPVGGLQIKRAERWKALEHGTGC